MTVLAGTEPAAQPGFAGLSRRQLTPHTDGTAVTRPPTLVMLVCAQPAPSGGEALLVDGRAVHAALQEHAPEAAGPLTRPDAARFGSSPGRVSPVFELAPAGRVVVRFRDDDLAVFNSRTHAALPVLRRLIADHTIVLPLEAGQGYLVQNGWWLHGRTRFAGQRLAWRILVEPWPIEQGIPLIEQGFAPLEPTPASLTTRQPTGVSLEEAWMPDANHPQRLALVASPPVDRPAIDGRARPEPLRMSGNAADPLHVENAALPALNDDELSGLIKIGAAGGMWSRSRLHPQVVKALLGAGPDRIAELLYAGSAGRFPMATAQARARAWVGVAQAAVALYGDDPAMPYADLAAELATQIRLLRGVLGEQKVHERDRERAYRKVEPDELARSLPCIAEIGAPLLVAATGRPQRFRTAARFKAFTGLTPKASETGETDRKGQAITKAGAARLRKQLICSANTARQVDPQLAAVYYHRQMVERGAHHIKALCVVAAKLAERFWLVETRGEPYVVRDLDGTPVTIEQARRIIATRYRVDEQVRRRRRSTKTRRGKAPQQALSGHANPGAERAASRRPSPQPASLT